MMTDIQSVRYPSEHKQETHDRIVVAAAREFRAGGASVGIAELMKALKLTHGGFYRHFKSKDELLAEALTNAMESLGERIARTAREHPGDELRTIIESYLSEAHCADAASGCPLAALGPELARESKVVRKAMEAAMRRQVQLVMPYVRAADEDERRSSTVALLVSMAGALGAARVVDDATMRRGILEAAKRMLLKAYVEQG